MPNYIATKDYFRTKIQENNITNKLLYVIPNSSYEYSHPEGTGHELSPFDSIWFCGLPETTVKQVLKDKKSFCNNNSIRIFSTLEELKRFDLVPTMNRANPAQRRRRKKKLLMMASNTTESSTDAHVHEQNQNKLQNSKHNRINSSNKNEGSLSKTSLKKKNKKKRLVENKDTTGNPKKKKKRY